MPSITERICNGCEIKFKRHYGKFCSAICYYTYQSKRNKTNNPGGYKKGSKTAERHSKRMKGNKFASGNHSNKGRSVFQTEEHKEKIRKHLNDNINSKGLNIPNGAKCKFYEIEGLRCQGKWELAYIKNLIKLNLSLPSKAKTITTPFGYYTPDFEFENEYIEIKSTYTLKTCVQNGQMKRIKWVIQNIKPVKIVVLSELKVKRYLSEL